MAANIWNNGTTIIDVVEATGSGAMSVEVTHDHAWRLHGFDMHINTAPTTAEDMTITKDADKGAAYDTVIDTIAMAGKTDIAQQATRPLAMKADDKLIFEWTNTDARTWAITVNIEKIHQ